MAPGSPDSGDNAAHIPHSLPRGARKSKLLANIGGRQSPPGGANAGKLLVKTVDERGGPQSPSGGADAGADADAGAGAGTHSEASGKARTVERTVSIEGVARERTISRGSSGSGGARKTNVIGKVSYSTGRRANASANPHLGPRTSDLAPRTHNRSSPTTAKSPTSPIQNGSFHIKHVPSRKHIQQMTSRGYSKTESRTVSIVQQGPGLDPSLPPQLAALRLCQAHQPHHPTMIPQSRPSSAGAVRGMNRADSQRPSTSSGLVRGQSRGDTKEAERPKTAMSPKRPVKPTSMLDKNPLRIAHIESQRISASNTGSPTGGGGGGDGGYDGDKDGERSMKRANSTSDMKSEGEKRLKKHTLKGVARTVAMGTRANRARFAGHVSGRSARVSIAPEEAKTKEDFSDAILADIVNVHGSGARGVSYFPGSEFNIGAFAFCYAHQMLLY